MNKASHTTDLTVIVLVFNEEKHIARAIKSVSHLAQKIVVVDSFSTDKTVAIAKDMGAVVLQNPFVNQAQQFQWAMQHADIETTWVMRIDADEYLTEALIEEVQERLPSLNQTITGIILKRQVHFMGQWIKHGGYYPIKLLRIWRKGAAHIEQRWMDEHMVLDHGKAVEFKNDFIDDNLNSLTWWTDKHNAYATREAIDLLNQKHHFLNDVDQEEQIDSSKQANTKRWYKNNLYNKLPLFLRAFLYFQYRYWIRLGFLDGRKGLIWHFLQGFWYRFLVDAKILQIEWWAKKEQKNIPSILFEKYNIDIKAEKS